MTKFPSHWHSIGVRFLGAFTTGYGGKEIPPYSRFYMGGENDIRGFDIRGISPVTYIPSVLDETISFPYRGGIGSLVVPLVVNSITFPGGDVEGVANLEYRIPIMGPVSATLFIDTGTTGILNKNELKLNSAGLTNINSQFPLLNQPAQLQIAPDTNFHLRSSTGIEFNINLPIVQAPFRIYWAYNPIRFHETIVAPYDSVNMNNLFLQCQALGLVDPLKPKSCDPIILTPLSPYLVNPGRLNYFEPRQTFRFTVSRTF